MESENLVAHEGGASTVVSRTYNATFDVSSGPLAVGIEVLVISGAAT
jgi:hypothetical protein